MFSQKMSCITHLLECLQDWTVHTDNSAEVGFHKTQFYGHYYFCYYVNDQPDSIKATAKMFGDDTKLFSNISTLADCEALWGDLNKLAVWVKTWLLNFNATKYVVLKIRQSLNYAYTLNGEILEVVEEQRDLRITIYENLKPSTHIKYITTKANYCKGLIKQYFESRSEKIIKTLYETMI